MVIHISDTSYQAVKNLNRYEELTRQQIAGAIRRSTQELYTLAVQLAPYRTGELKKSLQYHVTQQSGRVYTYNPVARFMEYGTKGAVITPIKRKALQAGANGWYMSKSVVPPIAARPFMQPAMRIVQPKADRRIKEAIYFGTT